MRFNDKQIAIVGMGYVGLPLAVEFGRKRSVIGFDTNEIRIKELKKGELEEGVYHILFDTKSIADGEYYYQIITDFQKTSKKFFVVNKL